MGAAVADFWFWWLGATRAALCRFGPRGWITEGWPTFLRLAADEQYTVTSNSAEHSNPLQALTLERERIPPRGLARVIAGRRSVLLRMDPKHFIIRKISPLDLPCSQLATAAALDLRAGTPFKDDEVHVLGLEPCGKGARYAVVKRDMLDKVLASFNSAGLRLSGLVLEAPDEAIQVNRVALGQLNGLLGSLQSRLLYPAVAMLALAIVATGAHAWHRNRLALIQLNVEVESLTAAAKITRAAFDKRAASIGSLAALRKGIEEAEPVSGIWEEVARILPDSAYLTEMHVKDGRVAIGGYASGAAALIVALEQSPLFEAASFMAPVVRVPGQDGERFQIGMSLEGES